MEKVKPFGVSSGEVSDHAVNMALSKLTDVIIKEILEKTFVGDHYGNLRSFLVEALHVKPETRQTGEWLLRRSFLGRSDRTIDHKGLTAQVKNQQ